MQRIRLTSLSQKNVSERSLDAAKSNQGFVHELPPSTSLLFFRSDKDEKAAHIEIMVTAIGKQALEHDIEL